MKNVIEIILLFNNVFVFQVALNIIQNVKECQKRSDLPKMERNYLDEITLINKNNKFLDL